MGTTKKNIPVRGIRLLPRPPGQMPLLCTFVEDKPEDKRCLPSSQLHRLGQCSCSVDYESLRMMASTSTKVSCFLSIASRVRSGRFFAAAGMILIALMYQGISVHGVALGQLTSSSSDYGIFNLIVSSLTFLTAFAALPVILLGNALTSKPKPDVLKGDWIENEEELMNLKKKILLCEKYCESDDQKRERSIHYARILSAAIQLRTISNEKDLANDIEPSNESELLAMHDLLRNSFPTLHRLHPPRIINKLSLLYHIPGSDSSLLPIMLCAHMDVVPAPNGPHNKWLCDPFSGEIQDGFVWGRGAIDCKQNVIGQLAAVERILDCVPRIDLKRSIYIALGHDEEIRGYQGAAFIAKHLKNLGIRFEGIFDEGGMIISGGVPGYKSGVGMVGVAEKGNVTFEFEINGPGGHSSMPPIHEDGLISIMSKALSRLQSSQMPSHFDRNQVIWDMLESLAWRMTPVMSIVCSNLWLFSPIIKLVFTNLSAGAAALVRTTTAITVISGGVKTNVLPYSVKAYVNHRIHPNDTLEDVLKHDRNAIKDKRIQIRNVGFTPHSPKSSTDVLAYNWIQRTVQVVYGCPTAPMLMTGNTDTRHYWDLSKNIYRFTPCELHISETKMFHGLNERIKIESNAKAVDFFESFILLSCS